MNAKLILRNGIIIVVMAFAAIQLFPYGHDHTNPPIQSEPNWDSPDTRVLAAAACFDCHSNETDWSRWYEAIAPASWLVQRDVDFGRRILNFSEWNQGGKPRELHEIWEALQERYMPPSQYLILHSEARLTQDQVDQLIAGLRRTVSNQVAGRSNTP